ncbi:MAG TPA: polyprenol monophosphomannose synthase [Tepidisphaeraceae bacterium]|nr:polyprenol monophosphomannose synthase [Tepidisphaeraceae bacterium]
MIDISVIVPTINEAENLPLLLPRIAAALTGNAYEVLIVDDGSTDNTVAVCAELAQKYPVHLLVRSETADGLSGAVLYGMARARGQIFCVMDADLQHPPEKLPELIEPLKTDQADFVLGSRNVAGGGTADGWTIYRQLNSGIATLLSRPFAGGVSDPMSGFFALRRQTYLAARRLTPLGYKIGLELMCKCRVRRVKEIPILFGLRVRGQSKLNLKQQFRYLEHLSRLYDFTFPRASPTIKFLIATTASWLAGFLAYAWLGSAPLAYLPALAVTTLFHLRYVNTQRQFIPRPRPWLDFWIISAAEWVACCAATAWTIRRVDHPSWMEGFLYPFIAATLVRYVLRKEFLQDIRGLRRDARAEELADAQSPPAAVVED